jgi:hypothetical protein
MSDERSFNGEAALIAEAKTVGQEIDALLPHLLTARKNWFRSRNDADAQTLSALQAQADVLAARHELVLDELQRITGISEEVFQQLEKARVLGDVESPPLRNDLTVDKVDVTNDIDECLPTALEEMLRLIDLKWLREDDREKHRLSEIKTGEPLSLVKGLRRQSEFPEIHRFLQTLRVAVDYIEEHPAYDHFAGALLVPQLASLGSIIAVLRQVPGVAERLSALWRGPSSGSDAVAYELLVAAACAVRGRQIEFITPTAEKSPDLRCHDPYPLVIECKRKRALSDYELTEEEAMCKLFRVLEYRARDKGVWGCFQLSLSIEASMVSIDDVVATLLRQRLAAHPERPLEYPWGTVSYHEAPRRLPLTSKTRAYSPNMLSFVFGWDSDVPTWDGLICRTELAGPTMINEVDRPIGLLWSNKSENAIARRSWSPSNMFGGAMAQIPPCESGIIYVAYQEGTRAEIADLRTEGFLDRVREWEHAASIRIPIAVLTRLYPRTLDHGTPDLIENSIRLYGHHGDMLLIEDFPTNVFTRSC